MHKRTRIHVRWPEPEAVLVRQAAARLDLSMSELIRRAATGAALDALRDGMAPPPLGGTGRMDGRSGRSVTVGVTTAEDPLSRNGDPQPGRPKARAGR